ncbi:hypothetical protein EON63_07405 [archaeon]|nr:MAG: hypothetical protein EON63_07405 [archaeon]
MYRLPALFVDDFFDVNPTLLHSAYVEAIYRSLRGEWEYHRLTQSYWFNVLLNVSVHKSPLPYIHSHPLIEDGLSRPRQRFDCGEGGKGCGHGTRRIPKQSC